MWMLSTGGFGGDWGPRVSWETFTKADPTLSSVSAHLTHYFHLCYIEFILLLPFYHPICSPIEHCCSLTKRINYNFEEWRAQSLLECLGLRNTWENLSRADRKLFAGRTWRTPLDLNISTLLCYVKQLPPDSVTLKNVDKRRLFQQINSRLWLLFVDLLCILCHAYGLQVHILPWNLKDQTLKRSWQQKLIL